jgi:hypothetical protein
MAHEVEEFAERQRPPTRVAFVWRIFRPAPLGNGVFAYI